MSEQRGNWIWTLLRKRPRKELDKLEASLVMRPFEKRTFAGDPSQAEHLRIPMRKQK
jgi:hypothetical protein